MAVIEIPCHIASSVTVQLCITDEEQQYVTVE